MSVSRRPTRARTLESRCDFLENQILELCQRLDALTGQWMTGANAAKLTGRSAKALTNLASRRPEGEGVWWRWNAHRTRREFNPKALEKSND